MRINVFVSLLVFLSDYVVPLCWCNRAYFCARLSICKYLCTCLTVPASMYLRVAFECFYILFALAVMLTFSKVYVSVLSRRVEHLGLLRILPGLLNDSMWIDGQFTQGFQITINGR